MTRQPAIYESPVGCLPSGVAAGVALVTVAALVTNCLFAIRPAGGSEVHLTLLIAAWMGLASWLAFGQANILWRLAGSSLGSLALVAAPEVEMHRGADLLAVMLVVPLAAIVAGAVRLFGWRFEQRARWTPAEDEQPAAAQFGMRELMIAAVVAAVGAFLVKLLASIAEFVWIVVALVLVIGAYICGLNVVILTQLRGRKYIKPLIAVGGVAGVWLIGMFHEPDMSRTLGCVPYAVVITAGVLAIYRGMGYRLTLRPKVTSRTTRAGANADLAPSESVVDPLA